MATNNKESYANQFYVTRESLVYEQIDMLDNDLIRGGWTADPPCVLDAGFGYGVYGRIARRFWPDSYIVGIDIEPDRLSKMDSESVKAYDDLVFDDFLTYQFDRTFTVVIGNPPYKDVAEQFVICAHEVLGDGGFISFLFKSTFGHSVGRWERLYENGMMYYREAKVVPRPSFVGYGSGTDSAEYSVWHWCKGDGDLVVAESCKLSWDKNRQEGQRRLFT